MAEAGTKKQLHPRLVALGGAVVVYALFALLVGFDNAHAMLGLATAMTLATLGLGLFILVLVVALLGGALILPIVAVAQRRATSGGRLAILGGALVCVALGAGIVQLGRAIASDKPKTCGACP